MNTGHDWEESYRAAILETDNGKLFQRIRAAKAAIDSRLEVLQLDHGGTPEERQAIADALAGLNDLRSERETRAHDAGSHPELSCSLCDKPLTLLSTDSVTDEDGKPVHPQCYFKSITG